MKKAETYRKQLVTLNTYYQEVSKSFGKWDKKSEKQSNIKESIAEAR